MVSSIQGNSHSATATAQANTPVDSVSQQSVSAAQFNGIKKRNNAIAQELIKNFSECEHNNFSTDSIKSFVLKMNNTLNAEKISDGQRYEISKTVLDHALSQTKIEFGEEKPLPIVSTYLEQSDFPRKQQLVVSLARSRMEQMVKELYDLSESDLAQASVPQRLTTHQRSTTYIAHGTYILLTCHLFNLENKVEALPECVVQACTRYKNPKIANELIGKSYKEAIILLAKSFPANAMQDMETRNFHPASLLLQECTGFAFHPSMLGKNPELMNNASPLSFQNLSETLALKYFGAQQNDCVADFFQNAFSINNACFEANVDAIANYNTGATIVFQPKPKWDTKLSEQDNLSGLLAWKQRELVTVYAKKYSVFLAQLPESEIASQINKIEASSGFTHFLTKNKTLLIDFLVKEYKRNEPTQYEQAPERIKSNISKFVLEDLNYGEALIDNKIKKNARQENTTFIEEKSDWKSPSKMQNEKVEKLRLQARLDGSNSNSTNNQQARTPLKEVLSKDEIHIIKKYTGSFFGLNSNLRKKSVVPRYFLKK